MMSLLPDKQIGVYTAANGPVPLNGWPRIHAYIMDVIMGEEPWVTVEELCTAGLDQYETYIEEGEEESMIKEQQIKQIMLNQKRTSMRTVLESERIGTYGNFAYGNITIFVNEETGRYNMLYGEKAYFDLAPIIGSGLYQATGWGALWQSTYLVTFDEDYVTVTFDFIQPPVFIRGLKQADAPPPPELCPEIEQPEAGKASSQLVSLYAMIITVVLTI